MTTFASTITSLVKLLDMTTGNESQREADLLLARGSATRFLSTFIIEPQIKITKSHRGHEHIQNIVNAEIEIFVSVIKTAFNILLDVYGFDARFAMQMLSSRDFIVDKMSSEGVDDFVISYDAKQTNQMLDSGDLFKIDCDAENDKLKPIEKVYREVILTASNGGNRSVGNGKRGDKKKVKDIKIKILVAASVQYIDPESIYNLLEVEGDMNAIGSRYDDMMAGSVSLLNFLIPLDIIKQYKAKRLNDRDDIISAVNKRKDISTAKLLTNQALGFARFYQMLNVSENERDRIEKIINGKLSKKRYKERFLEFTKSMLLAVTDDDYEIASFYIHDMEDEIEIDYKSLKNNSKNDTSEILKFLANKQY